EPPVSLQSRNLQIVMAEEGDCANLLLNITCNPSPMVTTADPTRKKDKSKGSKRVRTNKMVTKQQDIAKTRTTIDTSNFKRKLTDNSSREDMNKGTVQSTKWISSLFTNNPEIPQVQRSKKLKTHHQVFTDVEFTNVALSPRLVSHLEQHFHYQKMTCVQRKAIPSILNGRDCLIQSQTGTGKTIAYAVPIVNKLQELEPKIQRSDGPYALILLPTRELALQTMTIFNKLLKTFCWIVPGCVTGGEKKKSEKARIRKGINVLISTPGRLIDHIKNTQCLQLDNIKWLVLDECDRLLDLGFKEDINTMLTALNAGSGQRQTILVSATLTAGVQQLARLALQDSCYIDATSTIPEDEYNATTIPSDSVHQIPSELQQHYVVIPAKLRLISLISFFIHSHKKNKKTKSIVFLSTCDSVNFYYNILNEFLPRFLTNEIEISKLHGNISQKDVAARGLDIPDIDWVLQYNPPIQVTDYLHRIGRTARIGYKGKSLLVLLPSEVDFVHEITKKCDSSFTEIGMDQLLISLIPPKRKNMSYQLAASDLQMSIENFVNSSAERKTQAISAYQSYIRAYGTFSKSLKFIFHVRNLHLGHLAKSFGLQEAPSKIKHQIITNPIVVIGLLECFDGLLYTIYE
ncbi:putative ATP-dependent RNA helicase DDX31, partial [Trichoplax sp. H2]